MINSRVVPELEVDCVAYPTSVKLTPQGNTGRDAVLVIVVDRRGCLFHPASVITIPITSSITSPRIASVALTTTEDEKIDEV